MTMSHGVLLLLLLSSAFVAVVVNSFTLSSLQSQKQHRHLLGAATTTTTLPPPNQKKTSHDESLLLSLLEKSNKNDDEIQQLLLNNDKQRLDTNDYNTVLTTLTTQSSAETAEAFLMQWQKQYNNTIHSNVPRPNTSSYWTVQQAWLQQLQKDVDDNNIPRRMYSLLREATRYGLVPDVYMYTTILEAYAALAASGDAIWADRAERLLEEMKNVVNIVALNTVMKTYNHDVSAAEELVTKMKRTYGIEPDTITYATLMTIHANRGTTRSAMRVEEILRQMKRDNVHPNIQVMNCVINAWVQCGNVTRAEQVLDEMEQAYKDGTSDIVPNVVSYSTVMNGWAKYSSSNNNLLAIQKATSLMKRMKALQAINNSIDLRPNLITFVTLIDILIKSGFIEQAEQICKHEVTKPNVQLITTVMDGWKNSGNGERAERLLEWMLEFYKDETKREYQPNVYTFTSVISAWGKSRAFAKAVRARNVLDRMIRLHRQSPTKIPPPNTHCYTAVINSCAYTSDNEEMQTALSIAVKTFTELCSREEFDAKPNQVTFAMMLTAFRNLMPSGKARTSAVHKLFQLCCRHGQVDELVLRRVQSVLTVPQRRELFDNKFLTKDGDVDMEQLPPEWSCNIERNGSRRQSLQQTA